MRKKKLYRFGMKRRRDKSHRDLRFAIRFENWLSLYRHPDDNAVSVNSLHEPLFNVD